MKRILTILALITVLSLPALAQAEATGMYLAPKFLMSIQDTGTISRPYSDMTDESYSQFTLGGALAVGYDFYPQHQIPLRAEIEFALRGNSEKSWDSIYAGDLLSTKGLWNTSTLFLNLYYDIQTGTPFVPYIGAGAGLAFNYVEYDLHSGGDSYSINDNFTNFAWNVGAGVAYNFNENVAVDLGYRFMMMGYNEVSVGDAKISNQPYNNEFMLGLRFTF
ncbi:outer membrane beta-barrel protein [uncultured Desulfovibrio sp.]|uniref:outer membrane protein n=2 Tax=uncultured Desulfovibrio sp. TaxID=167968 RepID=UPI002634CF92|nr:outer membrane beta-barrel protein [uncultured Desulfovibrio sp.]